MSGSLENIMYDAILLCANSETNGNIRWATNFFAPDRFVYFEKKDGEKYMLVSRLEIGRAREEASVKKENILELEGYYDSIKEKTGKNPTMPDILDEIFKEMKIKTLYIPHEFSYALGEELKERGYKIIAQKNPHQPFFEKRAIKTETEIGYIKEIQGYVEEAMQEAIDTIKATEITKDGYLFDKGKERNLTAEDIKMIFKLRLLEHDCEAKYTIVVCGGKEAVLPHCQGSGDLKANEFIIIDVFPQSLITGFYTDVTRTVMKGAPSEEQLRQYNAVLEVQEFALSMVKAGADGSEIHAAVYERFEALGFETKEMDDFYQGFFHGTGHGLGLEIHEPPSLKKDIKYPLKEGQVVTVEPGLYYLKTGGVRIEDLVVVRKGKCENLTHLTKDPKKLLYL